ncbi:MAG: heavy metal translocating P-type ATPase [Armatimonadota bacterium]
MDHSSHDMRAEHDTHGQHRVHGGPEMHPTREKHAGHDINVLWRKFWVVLALTIPVVIFSPGIEELFGYTAPRFPGSAYIPFIFGSIIFFYGGVFFLKGALGELRDRLPGMMTLISMAIVVAFVYSLAVTFGLEGEALYWELSTLILIMLLGHWMEMRAIGSARGALQELAKLMPDQAERITNAGAETVPVSDLRADDMVLIRPGAKISADGEVVDGESSVNESMITGESRPVEKSPGEQVIAGTVNGNGSLRVKVTKVGEDTALAGIMRLVAEAQSSRSMAQNLADRAALWLTIIAIVAGTITFIYWFLSPLSEAFAFERAVTVLVIACPHALGLAIPLVVAISTTLAARNGLLVRDRLALEMARDLDVVVFDKTGTLTKGEHGVVGVFAVPGVDENSVLAEMASAEKDSEHIIARAIVKEAEQRNISLPEVSDFKALPGKGVEAQIDGRTVNVGGPRLLESLNLSVPAEIEQSINRAKEAGQTLVYYIKDGQIMAAVALADVIRPESREAVAQLREMDVSVAMLTGDSEDVARWVAQELGITEYYASVLPADKEKKVSEIRKQGRKVAMVGDGVNDAPALVSADVGIAIGAGTDVAVEAGGIILVRNDPRDVAHIIRLSKATYGKMIQNLLWATGYNIVAIPLAAGVLYNAGIVLPPAVGAILMSASTVIVAVNAQFLRRLHL